MTKTEANKKNKILKKIEVPIVVLAVMLLLSALVGVISGLIIALGMMIGFVLLLLYDKLHLAFPFVLFYNSMYGMALGVSVIRAYTILILISFLLHLKEKSTFRFKYALPLLVYAVFIFAVMVPINTSMVFLFLDIACCLILASKLRESEALKAFFRVYSLVCLISYLTGTIVQNTIGGEYEYSRFMATFEDPNYMGFFFTLAIFALVTLRLFDKRLRVVIVIALYIMLLMSLSITAIVVNIFLWLFYLIIMKKMKWWSIFILALVVFIAISLFNHGIENPDAPIIGDLAARIDEKLLSLYEGDLGEATTGRFDLAKEHFAYYTKLPLFQALFGGIPVNSRYVHPDFSAAAHNEFVDLLLNVGLIGSLILLVFFFSTMAIHIKGYKETKDPKSLCLIMFKMAWLCYAVSLTMFLDYRFMLMFFI